MSVASGESKSSGECCGPQMGLAGLGNASHRYSGYACAQDCEGALSEITAYARAGSAEAQRILGMCAIQHDPECIPARSLIRIAASADDAVARFIAEDAGWEPLSNHAMLEKICGETLDICRSHALYRPEPTETLSDRPAVRFVRRMLLPTECACLMAMSRTRMRPSTVRTARNRRSRVADVRISEDVGYSISHQDPVLFEVVARMARACGFHSSHAEPLTVVRYRPGGHFRAHYDTSEAQSPDNGDMRDEDDSHGWRRISMICYLSDGYCGGETAFPEAGFKVHGAPGDCIYFYNQKSDGTRDLASLHGSMPVKSGEKWVAVTWFREFPFSHGGKS